MATNDVTILRTDGRGIKVKETIGATPGSIIAFDAAGLIAAEEPTIIVLPTLIANCSNTASEITVVTVNVAANTWADGEEIDVTTFYNTKQNSGGAITLTLRVKCNSASVTLLNGSSISDSATVGKTKRGLSFLRVGNDVVFSNINGSGGMLFATAGYTTGTIGSDNFSTNIFSSVDFAHDLTLSVTAQWGSANANAYFNPVLANALKF